MFDFGARENEIMETLQAFAGAGLEFVVVGGYAVSAYRHRFSIDADVVIRKEDATRFEKILEKRRYKKTVTKKLENAYSSEFVRYERKDIKVSIDLLIGGLGMRQTGASVGFDFLFENSSRMKITGTEKSVVVRVPRREVLIILKLHAGRLTDLRDVAALSYGLDMEIIRKHLFRGDRKALQEHLKTLEELMDKPEFQDSFKGVFMEEEYRIRPDEIRKIARLAE
ncbi:MAG: hypothetical protein HYX24_01990 [Candidatus Aenigmarchaeota archaeon]|nr:hypothetical protein [Candidatus Aenigmarchaeota archaeon]